MNISDVKKKKVVQVMGEYRQGTLRASDGNLVTRRDVALAIALSEARGLEKSGCNMAKALCLPLIKSHIRAHTRRDKSGKVVQVREHETRTEAGGGYRPASPYEIDHKEYPKRLRKKTEAELRYIIKDAREAIDANPQGRKAGYYADEINYAAMELNRRKKGGEMEKSHVSSYTRVTRSGKVANVGEFERHAPAVAHKLTQILADDYGVGPVHAPKEAVVWAAGRMIKDGHSVEEAEGAVSANNRLREKHGKPLVYLPYKWHTAYTEN